MASGEAHEAEGSQFVELLFQSEPSEEWNALPKEPNKRFWSNLEIAADLLLNIGCFGDALLLYRMLCEHMRTKGQLTPRLLRMVASCLSCASDHQQFTHDGILHDIERLLRNMRLFWTYHQFPWPGTAQLHSLPETFDFLHKFPDPFEVLGSTPTDDRSLDFILYKYGVHVLSRRHVPCFNACSNSFDILMATMNPGPFAIKDGHLQNDCLSGCLRWCQTRIMNVFDGEFPISLGATQTLLALYSEYGSTFALFCYLWEIWQNDGGVVPWIYEEERFGLKVPEILKAVCIMITRKDSPWADKINPMYFGPLDDIERLDLSYESLLDNMRQISCVCTEFLRGTELALCMSFLAALKVAWIQEEQRDDHPFSNVPIEVRRAYATSLINRHLAKPVSATVSAQDPTSTRSMEAEVSRNSSKSISGHPFAITDIMCKASDPTLARSIGSSSRTWASVKKTAQRARDITRLSACPPGFGSSVADESMQTLSEELDMLSTNDEGETENHDQPTGFI